MRHHLLRLKFLLLSIVAIWGISACQPQGQTPQSTTVTSPAPATSTIVLNGAGATFPYFFYQQWFSEYNQLHPEVRVNYQPVASAAGIQQTISETVDFGASDIAMTDDEIAKVKRGVVLLPVTAGCVAIVYNLPGVESGLKLSREAFADIFLGKITQWNDPKITATNPGITLPALPIALIHRSDGSGTTAVLTSHLSAISEAWKEKVGSGLNVQWPGGLGIKSNAGVSAQVQQAEGTIGYVEYSYARQLKMNMVALQNKTGQYVEPNSTSAGKALSLDKLPDDLRVFIPDPESPDAYPIVTYSWLMTYENYPDAVKSKALRDLIQWGLTEGQKFSEPLGYVPLNESVVQQVLAALPKIKP